MALTGPGRLLVTMGSGVLLAAPLVCRSALLSHVVAILRLVVEEVAVSPDYRSEKMESAEGKGIARRAWDAYARSVNKRTVPMLTPLARRIAATQVADLLGFWMLWHLHGGFEGLEELGMSRATIFRKVKRFRTIMKKHPDEFTLTGVRIDAAAYWKAAARNAKY